jgi:hypothetical protein
MNTYLIFHAELEIYNRTLLIFGNELKINENLKSQNL